MKYGQCQCGQALISESECPGCGGVDIGWLTFTRWPSGKLSLLGETFWTSEHGFAEANELAANYVDYFRKCQATGKPSRHGSVTSGTAPVMKRVQRAL